MGNISRNNEIKDNLLVDYYEEYCIGRDEEWQIIKKVIYKKLLQKII